MVRFVTEMPHRRVRYVANSAGRDTPYTTMRCTAISPGVVDCRHFMVPIVETYSIDENFLNLGEFSSREVGFLARALRERVYRWVGIPTCVGIAPQRRWRW